MMWRNIIMVALGGALGACIRYVMQECLQSGFKTTLLINIIGSLAIGIFFGIAQKNSSFEQHWRLFLATGLCGGFTTFSAFSIENIWLLQEGKSTAAVTYIIISIFGGISAAWIGIKITS